MDKYILFLCAGKWQLPWLKYLKNKGHKIILVDPYDTSPCVPYADIFIQEDVKNADKIYEIVKANGYDIELVTSEQTDVSVIPVAMLAEKLGTRANPVEVVERLTNKAICREFIQKEFGKHCPEFARITTIEELLSFVSGAAADIIIKPVDAQSSRGIFKIGKGDDEESIRECFAITQSFTQKDYIIAEDFVAGRELTIEGICFDNKHVTVTGSNKHHFRTGIASDLDYPFTMKEGLKEELIAFHNRMVAATGLQFGLTHAEYIINEEADDFWLIEVACRGGGTLLPSHIVPWVSGVSLYDMLYSSLFEQEAPQLKQEDVKTIGTARLHFFEFDSGKVARIYGEEECRKFEFIIDMGLEFRVGDVLKNATDDRSRQGYVIIKSGIDNRIDEYLQQVYDTIKIEYESEVQQGA